MILRNIWILIKSPPYMPADNHYTYDFNGNRTQKCQINGATRCRRIKLAEKSAVPVIHKEAVLRQGGQETTFLFPIQAICMFSHLLGYILSSIRK